MAKSKSNPNKVRYHYTEQYLLDPAHRVTVDLIGLGGTGSQVLTLLTRLNAALIALDHPGLYIRAWDPDTVSLANIGRQLFSEAEIGYNKATCLISRVNRFFGLDWEAHEKLFSYESLLRYNRKTSNITISCVDSIAARMGISDHFASLPAFDRTRNGMVRDDKAPFYWLDYGNAQHTGQVVLGTMQPIKQPESKKDTVIDELPHVLQMFPHLADQDEDESGPSCSLAEALEKQDLYINPTLSNLGMHILWKMFREARIQHHGLYLNLETMNVNPIKI